MISDTPSSETVGRVASGARNIPAYSKGAARLPTVSCGFGTRAKLMPSPSKIEMVQSALGRCFSMMALEDIDRRGERNVVDNLAIAKYRNLDRHDLLLGHRADKQI